MTCNVVQGSVPELLMFMIYNNDLNMNVRGIISKLTNEIKIGNIMERETLNRHKTYIVDSSVLRNINEQSDLGVTRVTTVP